uniref:Uncharacterized protein n=1 Tax=Panagrolaimus davidi TaxID=227884 RepID=A0A914P1V4_9BILA
MGKYKSMNKNVIKYGVKLSAKKTKSAFKKHVKKPNDMDIDEENKQQLLAEAKKKQHEKQKEAAVLKSSEAGKPKRLPKVVENRLRTNDLPLYANKKAKGLKKAAPSPYNEATVFPTRRVTKKHIRKLMNQQRREEKAAERAANQMDLN